MRRGRHLGVLTVVLAACATPTKISTAPPAVAATTTEVAEPPAASLAPLEVAGGETSPDAIAVTSGEQGSSTDAVRPADVLDPTPSPEPEEVRSLPAPDPVYEHVWDQIHRMFLEALGSERIAREAVAISSCESINFKPEVVFGEQDGPYGEIGPFQIYAVKKNGQPGPQWNRMVKLGFTPDDLRVPANNIALAIDLRREIGHWGYPSGWTCARIVGLR